MIRKLEHPVCDVRLWVCACTEFVNRWFAETRDDMKALLLAAGLVMVATMGCAVPDSELRSVPPNELRIVSSASLADAVEIDGVLSEWATISPVRIEGAEMAILGAEAWSGNADCSGTVRMAWDEKNLYVAATIIDDIRLNKHSYRTGGAIWNGDCLGLWISTDPKAGKRRERMDETDAEIGFSPGNADNEKEMLFLRAGGYVKLVRAGNIVVQTRSDPDGYVVEASIPWKVLNGYAPKKKDVLWMNLAIDDADIDNRETQMVFSGTDPNRIWRDPSTWRRVILE